MKISTTANGMHSVFNALELRRDPEPIKKQIGEPQIGTLP